MCKRFQCAIAAQLTCLHLHSTIYLRGCRAALGALSRVTSLVRGWEVGGHGPPSPLRGPHPPFFLSCWPRACWQLALPLLPPLPQTLHDNRWDGEEGGEEKPVARLAAVLPTMRELRHLDLRLPEDAGNVAPPGSLTALQRLRGLTFVSLDEWRGGAERPLPGGAWLRSLRMLWTHWDVLAASAPVLATDAARLSESCALGPPDCHLVSHETWAAFWEFARDHPPLQILHLDGKTYPDSHNGGMQLEPWEGCVVQLVAVQHAPEGLALRRHACFLPSQRSVGGDGPGQLLPPTPAPAGAPGLLTCC